MQLWRTSLGRAGLAALVLALACGAFGAGETTSEPKKKHQLHWWESARPSKPTPAEQLNYANQLKETGHLILACRQYRAITYAWPQSPEASVAQYNYARLLEQRQKYTSAFEEYQYLLETYAGFAPYEEVLERQYAIADRVATQDHHFLMFKYKTPEEAIPLFETLIQNGPHWKKSAELQFRIARIYEKKGEVDLAMDAYSLYQQKYPASLLAEQAGFGHAKCAYEYAQRNPASVELRENAESIIQSFLDRYPHSEMAGLARTYLKDLQMEQASALYQQAMGYDKASRQTTNRKEARTLMAAARVSYQRVIDEYPTSRWADIARARISRIDQRMEPYREN